MYLDKSKIYPLKNRHFSHKEALYQEALYSWYIEKAMKGIFLTSAIV